MKLVKYGRSEELRSSEVEGLGCSPNKLIPPEVDTQALLATTVLAEYE